MFLAPLTPFPLSLKAMKKYPQMGGKGRIPCEMIRMEITFKNSREENQDGGVGRHTAPSRTTRTDRKSKGKEVQHQGNKK